LLLQRKLTQDVSTKASAKAEVKRNSEKNEEVNDDQSTGRKGANINIEESESDSSFDKY